MDISPATWPAISALLDEALALTATERDTWLQSLDGERAAFKDTLRELLSRAGGVETDDFLATLPRFTRVASAGPLTELAAGDAIGPYRLLSELGTGGMGAVWLAERSDGTLKRKVALKLPRMVWAKGLAERMARERDILASLEHPNIARLYDAGVDHHGRPYLALEYVEGQPIDVYAKERGLTVRQKLDLLLQVCAAVAFAHSRLVVHRDLKPSNIMVTADGQVRLLDFGIAKLMEGDSAKETQLTQFAGRALTLDYASPEQIKGEPIGTASDVYSLGVVAYELLTGAKPYRLKRGSAAELEEAIASADPPKASEASNDAAATKALRGDLDAILNRALKKDPAQRYATIDALTQDLNRHLNDEPVSAQPDALTYRAAKFLARYRVQAIAGAVAAVALMTAAVVSAFLARESAQSAQLAEASRRRAEDQSAVAQRQTALALEARNREQHAAEEAADARYRAEALAQAERQAAAEAVEQAQRAQMQARRAEAVRDYLFGMFRTNSYQRSDVLEVQNLTARELLDRGAARIGSLERADPPAHAYLLRTFGQLYHEMALDQRSIDMLGRAVDSARATYGPEHIETAVAELAFAWTLARVGRSAEAQTLVTHASRVLQRKRPQSPDYAQALSFEATLLHETEPERAAAAAERSLRLLTQLGEPGFRLAMAHNAHGLALRSLNQTDAALTAFGQARQRLDLQFGPESIESAHVSVEEMRTLVAARRWREAVTAGERALAVYRRLAKSHPALPVRPLLTLSAALLAVGDGPASQAALIEALALRRSVADSAARPTVLDVESYIAFIAVARGDCKSALGALPQLRARTPPEFHDAQVQLLATETLCRVRSGERQPAAALLAEARAIASSHRVSRFRQQDIARASAMVAAEAGNADAAAAAVAAYAKLAHPRDAALVRAHAASLLGNADAVLAATTPWLAPENREAGADFDVRVDGEMALLAAQALRTTDLDRARALVAQASAALGAVLVPDAPQLEVLSALRQQLAAPAAGTAQPTPTPSD